MPPKILFACNLNSVRSPMAAALLKAEAGARFQVESAGVYDGGLDPFVGPVLAEIGVALGEHAPRRLDRLDFADVDLAVALTPEAAIALRRRLPREKIELWEIPNPSEAMGGRDAILAAYREVRDELLRRLRARFAPSEQKP